MCILSGRVSNFLFMAWNKFIWIMRDFSYYYLCGLYSRLTKTISLTSEEVQWWYNLTYYDDMTLESVRSINESMVSCCNHPQCKLMTVVMYLVSITGQALGYAHYILHCNPPNSITHDQWARCTIKTQQNRGTNMYFLCLNIALK
jgi:hypothetical protein